MSPTDLPSVTGIDWSLLVILDREWFRGRRVERLAKEAIRGGATWIQYRDKISETGEMFWNAAVLRKVTRDMGVPLFINDRLDIALAAEADGLHVGQKDLPLPAIRKLAPGLVVGVSVSSLREFEGSPEADYYGVGAVFPTGTKKNARVPGLALVRSIRGRTSIPLIGIGGIHKANAREVLEAGCDGVAVISSVLAAGGIRTATRILRKSLSRVRVRP